MKDSTIVWQQVDTAIQQFLILELKVGMTFAEFAIHAPSTTECLRSRQLARRAYDTGVRWMPRARFTHEETRAYYRSLKQLRLVLNRLGDPVQEYPALQ
jgi:hypothetical protein